MPTAVYRNKKRAEPYTSSTTGPISISTIMLNHGGHGSMLSQLISSVVATL